MRWRYLIFIFYNRYSVFKIVWVRKHAIDEMVCILHVTLIYSLDFTLLCAFVLEEKGVIITVNVLSSTFKIILLVLHECNKVISIVMFTKSILSFLSSVAVLPVPSSSFTVICPFNSRKNESLVGFGHA